MHNFSARQPIMRDHSLLSAGLLDRLAPVAVAAAALWLGYVWALA